jgi:signal transduction histidine kinase
MQARHQRQVLLFLIAVLAPAAVLIGLAVRMIQQDRELAAKRAIDQRRAALDQLRGELSARLDAIKLQEINRLIRTPQRQDSANPPVIFTATLDGDRPVPPWNALPWQAPLPDQDDEFSRHRQEGETQEFARKDAAAAAVAYRTALASARTPAESAEGRLLLARALANSGNPAEAHRIYASLLDATSVARDSEGVGYSFYAAERLLDEKSDLETVANFLSMEAGNAARLTLPELYMIRTLTGSAQDPSQDPKVARRIAELERVAAMAQDVPRLRAQIENGAAWVPYGDEPWLVTFAPAAPPLPGLIVAVSAASVAPPGVQLLAHTTQGEALGEMFPGLRVQWSDSRFNEIRQGLPPGLWRAALALIVGIAFFGGYLLLRDVNRDLRMTEVRSQFVASVSHELKTPLTAIRMFAETLSMGRWRDEQTKSEYLETIVNESERLARLVDNVLDFSKIEQGKKIYRPRPMRLEDAAGSAVRAMQFPLAQQGFHLQLSVDPDLPEIDADSDAIQQAILNLLTNAMKYSGDAREIDLRLAARNGDAVIQVADHGLGMEPEEQKHIFEKFYRAPSHEHHLIAGTGLGLTLVAHIARAHGGRVEVESAPGAGSTFSILLPLASNQSAPRNGVHV